MATVIPMTTPVRQPFGTLDGTKLRNLQSIKNRQNAVTPNSAPFLKRRATSPENSDSENVDPNINALLNKRKRAAFDDDVSASKPDCFSLNTIKTTTKPQVYTSVATPHIETLTQRSNTPASAPAAAGRSPTKNRRPGLLGVRKRMAPPSFGIKSPSLSMTAALNGTIANRKPKKIRTIEESKPKSWFFDIFEESEEQQNYHMEEWNMFMSANSLDISDDESKAKERLDRGKENVDPNEVSAPLTRSMAAAAKKAPPITRKDMMTDEPRTPLGDLNPTEYYGDGLDATSVVLVQDGVAQPTVIEENSTSKADFTFEAPAETVVPKDELTTASIGAIIMQSAPTWDISPSPLAVATSHLDSEQKSPEQQLPLDDLHNTASTEIEIWESESAKDESEKQEDIPVNSFDENVFALQEL